MKGLLRVALTMTRAHVTVRLGQRTWCAQCKRLAPGHRGTTRGSHARVPRRSWPRPSPQRAGKAADPGHETHERVLELARLSYFFTVKMMFIDSGWIVHWKWYLPGFSNVRSNLTPNTPVAEVNF